MDSADDEEYITKKHNPDMSEEKWDNRWEKAKQVRKKLFFDEKCQSSLAKTGCKSSRMQEAA